MGDEVDKEDRKSPHWGVAKWSQIVEDFLGRSIYLALESPSSLNYGFKDFRELLERKSQDSF